MRGKLFGIVGLTTLLCAGLPVMSAPQITDEVIPSDSADVLKGAPGVFVLVEPLEKDTEQDGLTTDAVKTDVELKLRQSGITVLTKAIQPHSFTPTLYININAMKSRSLPLYAYGVNIAYQEDVILRRNIKKTVVGTPVWQIGMVGMVPQNNLKEVRESTKDLVDRFCNAYLTANPKK